ncbi:ABC transporter ATP-binding protein [Nocardia sp. BMG51109]|uniref:dipeptide ABC transporter ATP-binding protein n=1 Tax=Nocardia sp. BMG51109 TaxID=1056816 RepID=UPI000463279E|nr:ABC transporter ATP-binding protein [Nocardia sp. BMG51109]
MSITDTVPRVADSPRVPGGTADVVLDVRGLSVRFGARTVVDGIDLTARRGEVVALVGESGSGKSMTARSVLGLLPEGAEPQGSIVLGGTEIIGASERELQDVRGTRVAMVFQEPQTALNPVQKIGTQIGQALRARGPISRADARARAVELLGLVGIPEPERRAGWYPHQLSGGQKQRVVIALALSGEPDLLIADEPTTALDVTVQAEILDLLRELQRRNGTTILFITHNLGVVAEVADRVVVLHGGRVIEQGPVRELFATPRESYTRDLLSSVPLLPGTGTEVNDFGAVEDTTPGPLSPESDPKPVLQLTELSVVYRSRGKRFRALHDVSLSVAPREVIGLVGESGSGKSTLGRAALGLVPAQSGEVTLHGTSLSGLSPRELRAVRKNVALVHQDVAASLDPRRTIEDSVGEPLLVHRVAGGTVLRAKVGDLLESVRLPRDYAQRRPGELSGGQRQRVALARALALAPRLLVADEPTSALDVSVQAQVLDLFADLRAEYHFACLFISHDLAVVHRVADRVVVLRDGSIAETGSPGQVFGSPRAEYTRRLLAAVPIPDPDRARRRSLGFGS